MSFLLAFCALAVGKTCSKLPVNLLYGKAVISMEVANSPSPSSLIVQRVEQIRRRNWANALANFVRVRWTLGPIGPKVAPAGSGKSSSDREERLMAGSMWKPVLANPTPNGNQGSRTRLRNGYSFVRIEVTAEIRRQLTPGRTASRVALPPES